MKSPVGKQYLEKKGIKENNKIDENIIKLENKSKHTLENLSNARALLKRKASLMVSNRYHLYRSMCLAKGLKLPVHPIAAEKYFTITLYDFFLYLKEAYLIHWYFSGKLWVYITNNKTSKSKIS